MSTAITLHTTTAYDRPFLTNEKIFEGPYMKKAAIFGNTTIFDIFDSFVLVTSLGVIGFQIFLT